MYLVCRLRSEGCLCSVMIQTKIDITKKDIELMSEFGMSDLIPGFVEELTGNKYNIRVCYVSKTNLI